mmetsp:Transcript_105664/g.295013  ORF Transcript_105664/g.295013 Transcript_105664/m.295013 type:complete len:400 (+) Transcript_105664:2184-3383(+)
MRSDSGLTQIPATCAHHGYLNSVADQHAVAKLGDGVAAREGVAEVSGHAIDHSVPIFNALRITTVESDPGLELPVRNGDDRCEVHTLLRDGAGFVEYHGGDFASNRDASRLQAIDLKLGLETCRRRCLANDHAHRQHRIQRHCASVDDNENCPDPAANVNEEHVDSDQDCHVQEQRHVDVGKLVEVFESDARREEHHPDQLAPRRQGPDSGCDHDRLSAGGAVGLQDLGPRVAYVAFVENTRLRIFGGQLLHRHGLTRQHRLVSHDGALDQDAVARQLWLAAIVDSDDVPKNDLLGADRLPLPLAHDLAVSLQLGQRGVLYLVGARDAECLVGSAEEGDAEPQHAQVGRAVDHVGPCAHGSDHFGEVHELYEQGLAHAGHVHAYLILAALGAHPRRLVM